MHVWRPEGRSEDWAVSLHLVTSEAGTQITSLDSKGPYPLSHLAVVSLLDRTSFCIH